MLCIRANGTIVTDFDGESPYLFKSYRDAELFINEIRAPNYVYSIEEYVD